MIISGPMGEPAMSDLWQAAACMACRRRKDGAHYNIFNTRGINGMQALRTMFPGGCAGSMNLVLFSTSGVHGTYSTIEDAEAMIARGNKYEDGEDGTASITFLIVHPRIVCLRYGNCEPQNADDIVFLKTLRASSWEAVQEIGRHDV